MMAELLLDAAATPPQLQAHLDGCEACRRELEELRATMTLLDAWEAPEPDPYFLTRLQARCREARAATPESWLARLRNHFSWGGGPTHVRPLAAMALTVVLLLGGGTYLGMTDWVQSAASTGQASVVHDLQTMDNNAQLLDQLETLSSNNNGGN